MGTTVVFDGLAKRYDLRVVFKGISGRALPGEVLTLIGPNGSGKSTLVRILCGLARPTRGSVTYQNQHGEPVEQTSWRHVLGVVAPSMMVYEELTAMENLVFYARVRGLVDAQERCRQVLGEVGLDPDRLTLVGGYSTGQQQRLRLAQAVLHAPQVLLLDEPGSNLDPAGQEWLKEYVAHLVEEQRTVILATNDEREMAWGDRHVSLSQ